MRPADPRMRYLYAVWAFLEITGFAGIAFGWGSLVYVLKEEGLYRNLCPDELPVNETINVYHNVTSVLHGHDKNSVNIVYKEPRSNESGRPCPAQDARLNLVFSVTSSFYCLAAFGLGQINYKYGTRVTRLVATGMFILGALAVAFTSNEMPWLIFPGMCLIASGGMSNLITNMQVALLFPKAGALLIGFFVGGYQFSSGVFELIKYSYDHGFSSRTSFLILGISHVLTLVSTFLFLPKDFIKKPPESDVDDNESSQKVERAEKLPPLRTLVLSPTYLLHLYWTSVLQLRYMFVLSSLNVTLQDMLHSDEEVSRYTNITAYIMLGGLIVSPIVGAFCNHQTNRYSGSISLQWRSLMPTVLPLAFGTTSGVFLSAVMFVGKPESIYLIFLLLIIFRAFLFTMYSALLMAVYPGEYFGFLFGLNSIVCALINLLQYALFSWGTLRGFYEVNIFLLVTTASTYIHPLYQWWAAYRAESLLSRPSTEVTKNMKAFLLVITASTYVHPLYHWWAVKKAESKTDSGSNVHLAAENNGNHTIIQSED